MQREIEIIQYHNQYQQQVIDLILGIQQGEFNIPLTLTDQPDLEQIEDYYLVRNGNFYIAKDRDHIIGTIGALDIGNQSLALRKMFVDSKYRGSDKRISITLLKTMIDYARSRNIQFIYLGTTEAFKAAHRFYEKNNFHAITPTDLPFNFPKVKVDTRYYRLDL